MFSKIKNGSFLGKVTPKLNASNGRCLAFVWRYSQQFSLARLQKQLGLTVKQKHKGGVGSHLFSHFCNGKL